MTSANAIDHLVDACIDDARMLQHESRTVAGHRRELLEDLARERAVFAEQLLALEEGHHARSHPGSWTELARELARSLRSGLGVSTDGDAVAACRRSCRRTEERFDRALSLPWSEASRAIIAGQRTRLDDASRALISIQF